MGLDLTTEITLERRQPGVDLIGDCQQPRPLSRHETTMATHALEAFHPHVLVVHRGSKMVTSASRSHATTSLTAQRLPGLT